LKFNCFLLNLPDTIQFRNGNQIVNKYDAGGRKLASLHYTLLYTLPAPLTEGEVLQLYYDMDFVDETGTFHVDNIEYEYNGKEFVEMHGLDEYDSEARWYYPAIMRTTTMDPLAEKYYDISPYAWCANNPVKFVDPDGRDVLIWYRNGNGGMNSFLYKGGNVNHANSYVNKVVNALNYNIKNGGGKPSRTAVYDSKLIVSIYETDGKQSSGKGVAYWNPELGLLVDNGNVLSPATGLDHELDHAIQALLNPAYRVWADSSTGVC